MLIHLELFNQTFSYLCQNNFISNSDQIPSKYFYSGYWITNGFQLDKTNVFIIGPIMEPKKLLVHGSQVILVVKP